jgi:glycosyltransferase involved in cell wall biosynthesis
MIALNPSTKKSIHVFASDFLPFPACPRTAGGNRSMQVISALRNAGHYVTFSMPLITHLAKTHLNQVLPSLTPEERWCCDAYFDPEIVLNRIQPDVAVYCNVNLFRTVRRFEREVVHVLDLYGPLQFEGLLFDAKDPNVAVQDAHELEARCREMVERLRYADYIVTVSERQKYFWSAYCSLAGFSFDDLNVLVCPVSFEVPPVVRKTAPNLTVVYSGGFYPWQNPDHALRAAVKLLEQHEGAKLHIFGGPHAGLPNEADVHRLLEDLQRSSSVEYHGYRPVEDLMAMLSQAWCALELMERNIERELAITGRTVEFLSTGTPVIYNDYSTLSGLIKKYEAGWTLPPSDFDALGRAFEELAHGGPTLVDRLSRNARRLAIEQFSPETSMAALLRLCDQGVPKRAGRKSTHPVLKNQKHSTSKPFRVLAISPDSFALVDLRVNNPLRALQRQGLISGFTTAGITFDRLIGDRSHYDVVLIQRAVPEYIYLTLVNLGLPFALDVDDNLLARAAYRRDAVPEIALLTGLRHATVITVPNPRIMRLLEKYSGISVAHKAFVTPNGLPFPLEAQPSSQPKQIVWIQSDIAALTTSRQDVVRAVEEFSRKHALPIVLIGRNVIERPQFTHQKVMGELDFSANLQFLEFTATSIGVAPLETVADEETLDFVAGKSDLKMLLFDGYGHPAVYSDAPPYTDSPFRSSARLVPNSYADWIAALEDQFRDGWRTTQKQSETIRHQRHIDRVARESWLAALEGAVLPKSVAGADLYEAFYSVHELKDTASSNLGYIVANEDVAHGYIDESHSAMDHFERYGRAEKRRATHDAGALDKFVSKLEIENAHVAKRLTNTAGHSASARTALTNGFDTETHRLRTEISELRNSLSWRVTAPLRRLAKPFMERNGR